MKELAPAIAAALEAHEVFRDARRAYCIVGGLAVFRWGEPRFTQDVDMSILCPIGSVVEVVSKLSSRLSPRFDEAVEFARRSHVYLAQSSVGFPIDIALGFSEYERRCIDRASPAAYAAGVMLMTCSAEDLLVQKLLAARPHDLVDAEGILIRQGGRLDWALVHLELEPLAELRDDVDIMDLVRALRKRAGV